MMKSGIAAALTFVLVGCGSATDGDAAGQDDTPSSPAPTSSSPETPTVKPATGATLSAKGFSVNLPRGWADTSADAPDGVALSGVDVGADENPAMLIVRRLTEAPDALGTAESDGVTTLESDGARRVRPLDRVEIAGQAAAHVRGVRSGGGVHVMLDQFTLLADSGTWVITFSTNQWQVDKDRQRMIDSVLATVSLGA